MEGNSSGVCRICLSPKKRLLAILDGVFETFSYVNIYFDCIGRNLTDFPSHSNSICKQCENEMIISYQFRRKCLATEEKLAALSVKVEQEEEEKPVFVEVKEELEDAESANEQDDAEDDDDWRPEDHEEEIPRRGGKRGPRKRRPLTEAEELEEMKKKWPCEVCGRRYHNRTAMNAHRYYSHKLRPEIIPCKRCGNKFQTREEKNGHECVRHCEQCNKKISGKHFVMHMLRHTSTEKAFKCDQCPKEYHTPADLTKHKLVTHVRSEFTLCVVCGKMVKQVRQIG